MPPVHGSATKQSALLIDKRNSDIAQHISDDNDSTKIADRPQIQDLASSALISSCESRPITHSGKRPKRPKTIPPAMHGYIRNHVGRIAQVPAEEIERQKLVSRAQHAMPLGGLDGD